MRSVKSNCHFTYFLTYLLSGLGLGLENAGFFFLTSYQDKVKEKRNHRLLYTSAFSKHPTVAPKFLKYISVSDEV